MTTSFIPTPPQPWPAPLSPAKRRAELARAARLAKLRIWARGVAMVATSIGGLALAIHSGIFGDFSGPDFHEIEAARHERDMAPVRHCIRLAGPIPLPAKPYGGSEMAVQSAAFDAWNKRNLECLLGKGGIVRMYR